MFKNISGSLEIEYTLAKLGAVTGHQAAQMVQAISFNLLLWPDFTPSITPCLF